MKHNFFVKKWPQELMLEEVRTELVPFWVQIRGAPLYLSSEENDRRLVEKIGEVEEVEDPGKARGFLRVKVIVNKTNPFMDRISLRKDSGFLL